MSETRTFLTSLHQEGKTMIRGKVSSEMVKLLGGTSGDVIQFTTITERGRTKITDVMLLKGQNAEVAKRKRQVEKASAPKTAEAKKPAAKVVKSAKPAETTQKVVKTAPKVVKTSGKAKEVAPTVAKTGKKIAPKATNANGKAKVAEPTPTKTVKKVVKKAGSAKKTNVPVNKPTKVIRAGK